MQEEKNMPTVNDFCKALEKSGKTKASNHIRQSIVASRLLNPLLADSLPKEMNEKLAVFRTPTISECILFALPCFTFWIYIFKMLSRKSTRV